LIHFTSNRRNMGEFATPIWARVLAWLTAAIIVSLNVKLVIEEIAGWVDTVSHGTQTMAPWPALAVLGLQVFLYGLLASAGMLLGWVTLKPWIRPSAAWTETPPVKLDWADALSPRPLKTIGVALEHSAADSEILNRALSLARPNETRIVLIHVADTPLSEVYGADAADRHTEADERYLVEVARVLGEMGYRCEPLLLHGANRAGQIVASLRRDPVDLLVVGSHGHGIIPDLLFGQTVDKVRHGLDIPMLIARPTVTAAETTHTEAPETIDSPALGSTGAA
jgi:manganese transport protein